MDRLYKLICISFLFQSAYGQWCCVDTSLAIPDNGSINMRLQIKGAVNNDLANSMQGVCGVRIKFKHEFVGDLTMTLTSPSGQQVNLIGPIGNSGFTSFSKWTVSFVRCKDVAVPDLGFKPRWDNIQNWGILGQFYNGTYYPSSGCLESINTGPVNGTWTLNIVDNDFFYTGIIESFCLLFCDNNGISCNSCSPNGGYFNSQDISYCIGDSNLNLSIKPTLPAFTPDPTLYGYTYFISQNDKILDVTNNLDLRSYPSGEYFICGISYLLADNTKLASIGQSLNDFKNSVIANKTGICAEFSKDCLHVLINDIPKPVDIEYTICEGKSYIIGGQEFFVPGNYDVHLSSDRLCDSLVHLKLNTVLVKAIVLKPEVIDCNHAQVELDANLSSITSQTNFSWSTIDGNIVDSSNPKKIIVNQAGNYKLIIADADCIDSVTVSVSKNGIIPSLKLEIDTINCYNPIIQCKLTTDAGNPSYNWSDGINSIGFSQIQNISKGGKYFVTVTDANGCSNFTQFEILEDKSLPSYKLEILPIDCINDTAKLFCHLNQPIESVSWIFPGNNIIVDTTSFSLTIGKIPVIIKGLNGCEAIDTANVISKIKIPDLRFQVDTLTCEHPDQIIHTFSNANLVKYIWTGQDTFPDDVAEPVVSKAGKYSLKIIDDAGCTFDTIIEVFENKIKADIVLSAGVLDCINDSIQIILKHNNPVNNTKYNWVGPPGFMSQLQNPFVKQSGTYLVTVINENGCPSYDSIIIKQDPAKPQVSLNTIKLNCLQRTDTLKVTSNSTVIAYLWDGPMGMSNASNLMVNRGGTYYVTITGSNGCTSEQSAQVDLDTLPPFRTLNHGDLNCKLDSITMNVGVFTGLDSIVWTGPNNYKFESYLPLVRDTGWYYVFARSENGCSRTDSVLITKNSIKPNLNVLLDTITCVKPEIILRAFSNSPGTQIVWTNPLGVTDTSRTIITSIAGKFNIQATSINGCDSVLQVDVIAQDKLPMFTLQSDTLNCKKRSATIQLLTSDTALLFNWNGPGINANTSQNLQVSKEGKYYVTVTNSFGCKSIDSIILLSNITSPDIQFTDSTFNCKTITNASLAAKSSESGLRYEWITPAGNVFTDSSISILQQGFYFFTAENKNLCVYKDTLRVRFDTSSPRIIFLQTDTINCFKDTAQIVLETNQPNGLYQWRGPNMFSSTATNPRVIDSGYYFVNIIGSNFCTLNNISIYVPADTTRPIVKATGTHMNCKIPRAKLDVISNDTSLSYTWETPNNDFLKTRNPSVIIPGLYILIVKAKNHCLASDTFRIINDTIKPTVTTNNFSLPCNADSVQLKINVQGGIDSIIWQKPPTFYSTTFFPFVKEVGDYKVFVIGKNFCQAVSTVTVDSIKRYPKFVPAFSKLDCLHDSIQLLSGIQWPDSFVSWIGPNFFETKNQNPYIRQAGQYKLTALSSQFCQADTLITVEIDTFIPTITIEALDSIVCDKNQIPIQVNSIPIFPNLKIKWSTTSGKIIGSDSASVIQIEGVGDYSVHVTNPNTGCSTDQLIQINKVKDSKLMPDIQSNGPLCDELTGGQINILDVQGGKSPYQYSLDNSTFNQTKNFIDLTPGMHQLRIIDENKCAFDTVIIVPPSSQLQLELGPDKKIHLGESVGINGTTNADTLNLNTIQWTPDLDVNCAHCFSIVATPLKTTKYQLKLLTRDGCEIVDDITIFVNSSPRIFVPSIFSPNGDQINDYIQIFAGIEVDKIIVFDIYDRWGNQVFAADNFDPANPHIFWDGTFRGQKMNPGVFTYRLHVLLKSGEEFNQSGDITLIR